jgi:hypothetical protein
LMIFDDNGTRGSEKATALKKRDILPAMAISHVV